MGVEVEMETLSFPHVFVPPRVLTSAPGVPSAPGLTSLFGVHSSRIIILPRFGRSARMGNCNPIFLQGKITLTNKVKLPYSRYKIMTKQFLIAKLLMIQIVLLFFKFC